MSQITGGDDDGDDENDAARRPHGDVKDRRPEIKGHRVMNFNDA